MSKNIAFFGTKPWEKEYIESKKEILADAALWFTEEILSNDHMPKETNFDAISVFVDSTVTKEVLAKFPILQFIATRSTGYDHIDMVAAKSKGVEVSSVPSYGANTVAEMAFGLILSLSRKIFESYDRIRESGNWSVEGLRGFDLMGKTIGVVGTGKIGRHVISIAKGFGMNVIGYDPKPNLSLAAEFDFPYKPLNDLLAESDVVTLHLPYMPETHHLMDDIRISLMKPGALLINTSRGGIVDTNALVKALKDGRLGGAGLDVLEEEGVIKDEPNVLSAGKLDGHDLRAVLADHLLIDMPNVIVTPHNAFNTWEALRRILDTSMEDIKGYISGAPTNLVS